MKAYKKYKDEIDTFPDKFLLHGFPSCLYGKPIFKIRR
jgi:hypothetical protein